jgi:hypothetical protein
MEAWLNLQAPFLPKLLARDIERTILPGACGGPITVNILPVRVLTFPGVIYSERFFRKKNSEFFRDFFFVKFGEND